MKNMGTSRGSQHDQSDLVEICPSAVSEWFCLRMLLDVLYNYNRVFMTHITEGFE